MLTLDSLKISLAKINLSFLCQDGYLHLQLEAVIYYLTSHCLYD